MNSSITKIYIFPYKLVKTAPRQAVFPSFIYKCEHKAKRQYALEDSLFIPSTLNISRFFSITKLIACQFSFAYNIRLYTLTCIQFKIAYSLYYLKACQRPLLEDPWRWKQEPTKAFENYKTTKRVNRCQVFRSTPWNMNIYILAVQTWH